MTASSIIESTRALVPAVRLPAVPLPSSGAARGLAHALGWFSLALGLAELFVPNRLAAMLGLGGREVLVQAYGGREIAAGVTALAGYPAAGMWARVVGDVVDLATLSAGRRTDRKVARNLSLALVAVGGIALLDLCVAGLLTAPRAKRG